MNSSFDASYSGGDTRDSFAEALSRLSQPEALFDVEESPALLWSDIITRELEDLQGSSQDHTIDHLKLERNAWDLVHALYSFVCCLLPLGVIGADTASGHDIHH